MKKSHIRVQNPKSGWTVLTLDSSLDHLVWILRGPRRVTLGNSMTVGHGSEVRFLLGRCGPQPPQPPPPQQEQKQEQEEEEQQQQQKNKNTHTNKNNNKNKNNNSNYNRRTPTKEEKYQQQKKTSTVLCREHCRLSVEPHCHPQQHPIPTYTTQRSFHESHLSQPQWPGPGRRWKIHRHKHHLDEIAVAPLPIDWWSLPSSWTQWKACQMSGKPEGEFPVYLNH